jgi:hypothetical protein
MPQPDSAQSASQITEATVMRGQVVRIGSRVKHWGQRWTGCATATVVGFERAGDTPNPLGFAPDWVKVLVEPDSEPSMYGSAWDWDRTEVAPDVG